MRGTANTSTAGRFAGGRRGPLDHAEVLRLRACGVSVQNIAQMTGSCMEDVARILAPESDARNDNAAPPPPATTHEERRRARDYRFRAMWLADVTRVEICHALGISQSTLDIDRARLDLPRRTPGAKLRKVR